MLAEPKIESPFVLGQVINVNGKIFPAYHGTCEKFERFAVTSLRDIMAMLGYHFTEERIVAEVLFAGRKDCYVYEAELSVTKAVKITERELVSRILSFGIDHRLFTKATAQKVESTLALNLPYFSLWNEADLYHFARQIDKKTLKKLATQYVEHLKSRGINAIHYMNEIEWAKDRRFDWVVFDDNQIEIKGVDKLDKGGRVYHSVGIEGNLVGKSRNPYIGKEREEKCHDKNIRCFVSDESYRFIYVVDNKNVSVLHFDKDRSRWILRNAFTLEDYRRRGYGTKLFAEAKRHLNDIAFSGNLSEDGKAFINTLQEGGESEKKKFKGKGKGDCFQISANLLIDYEYSPEWAKEKYKLPPFAFIGKPVLVHGEVSGKGKLSGIRFSHAWVEDDHFVYDFSLGKKAILPKELYYRLGEVDKHSPNKYRRYNAEEAQQRMEDTGIYGHWDLDCELEDGGMAGRISVFHGTPDARFSVIKNSLMGQHSDKITGGNKGVIWFTDNYNTAKSYAVASRAFDYQGAEPKVLTYEISLSNPLVVDAKGALWRKAEFEIDGKKIVGTRQLVEYAKKKGHDGLIVKNVFDHYNHFKGEHLQKKNLATNYAVFNDSQVFAEGGESGSNNDNDKVASWDEYYDKHHIGNRENSWIRDTEMKDIAELDLQIEYNPDDYFPIIIEGKKYVVAKDSKLYRENMDWFAQFKKDIENGAAILRKYNIRLIQLWDEAFPVQLSYLGSPSFFQNKLLQNAFFKSIKQHQVQDLKSLLKDEKVMVRERKQDKTTIEKDGIKYFGTPDQIHIMQDLIQSVIDTVGMKLNPDYVYSIVWGGEAKEDGERGRTTAAVYGGKMIKIYDTGRVHLKDFQRDFVHEYFHAIDDYTGWMLSNTGFAPDFNAVTKHIFDKTKDYRFKGQPTEIKMFSSELQGERNIGAFGSYMGEIGYQPESYGLTNRREFVATLFEYAVNKGTAKLNPQVKPKVEAVIAKYFKAA